MLSDVPRLAELIDPDLVPWPLLTCVHKYHSQISKVAIEMAALISLLHTG